MNIKQLKFANAVVEKKSFSLAASSCFVTQPTLSNSIQALEKEFGQAIFIRTTRKVELSDFGKSILPFIHSILNAEDELINHIEKTNKSDENIIRLGLSPLVNSKMIMLVIEAFKSIHNNCEVLVNEINLDDLQQQLSDEKLNIIVVPRVTEKVPSKHSKCIFLYKEPLHLVTQKTLPKNDKNNEINLEDIRNETFLMVPNSCGLSIITRNLLKSLNEEFKEYGGKALSYHVLADWASSGLGVALLPKSKIPDSIKASSYLHLNEQPIDILFDAQWNHTNTITKEFISFLEEHIHHIKR